METKAKIEILKAIANDLDNSTNNLIDANIRYRELIINLLPIILRQEFNMKITQIPSNVYLKELCAIVENPQRFNEFKLFMEIQHDHS